MTFAHTLRQWYDENARTLPWRGEKDPYKIWVSEIILQQTRVQQGWNYYLRFIETFPNIRTLAEASEEQVLCTWQGLGYYTRARNMRIAAQQIIERHNGQFPSTYSDIRNLKGIGDYTAAAIGSIAFAMPYPAVDGNVLRIISRIFGITDDISLNKTRSKITELCRQNIDTSEPGIFNQACMDFGSMLCVPKNPLCEQCPFRRICYAHLHQLTEKLPVKKEAVAKRKRFFHFVCSIYNNNVIIEKRIGEDIWRNLYQFPLQETCNDQAIEALKPFKKMKETLTHQIIHAIFYINHSKEPLIAGENQRIVKIDELSQFPMPKVMVSFIKNIQI